MGISALLCALRSMPCLCSVLYMSSICTAAKRCRGKCFFAPVGAFIDLELAKGAKNHIPLAFCVLANSKGVIKPSPSGYRGTAQAPCALLCVAGSACAWRSALSGLGSQTHCVASFLAFSWRLASRPLKRRSGAAVSLFVNLIRNDSPFHCSLGCDRINNRP
jgi:hypothetical protein